MRRKIGDRRDGVLLRRLDAMHYIMPIIYPNRCDNEAFISERIDLTNIEAFLKEKNRGRAEHSSTLAGTEPDLSVYPYNLFQLIVTALLKTVTQRKKLNRFIVNGNMYQRRELTAAFVVKKAFEDDGEEGLAVLHADGSDTLDTIHEKIFKTITTTRGGGETGTSENMDIINRLPRFISKSFVKFVTVLDRHGKIPQSFIDSDPYYCTAVISNLGSIRLHSGYHHLTNWGTTSLFLAVGERKKRPFYDEEGNAEMRESIDLGITIDERLADGYYYSGSVRLLRKLLENPELLEEPLSERVEI
ncbi:MAG: 2-oxo acid dehydrogenase subunit E2 [Anaerovoracaceae bacterium]|nr:2-oxo acid dehydrogenase subunit E2 [Anaerovoracaceae bacterium]